MEYLIWDTLSLSYKEEKLTKTKSKLLRFLIEVFL